MGEASGHGDPLIYWASLDGLDLAEACYSRVRNFYTGLTANSIMFRRWAAGYRVFYGLPGLDDPFDVGKAGLAGDIGQLTAVKVNHAGSLARQKIALVSQTIPDFDATPTNDDESSIEAVEFAKKLLAYYMDHRRLASQFFRQAKVAELAGQGFLRIEWDATKGERLATPDPMSPARTRTGDLSFKVFHPLDVPMNRFRYDNEHDWLMTREFLNRFDVAAQYAPPEGEDDPDDLRNQILSIEVPKQLGQIYTTNRIEDERRFARGEYDRELIPVYTMYHKHTASLPDGKIAVFLSPDILLREGPNPYGEIPIVEMVDGEMVRSPYGESGLQHILGMQEVNDNVESSVATNNVALATALLWIPEECNYSYEELTEGLAALTGHSGVEGKLKPEAVNLNPGNDHALKYLDHNVKNMETLMNIPATMRGSPQENIESGSFGALITQQALTNNGEFQQSFHNAVARGGQLIIKILKLFADQPMVAFIAGKRRSFERASFSKANLMGVEQVIVKSGNPAARTAQFADQMADNLLNKGLLVGPDGVKKYVTLIKTGDLDSITEAPEGQELLIRREFEMLLAGQKPTMAVTDQHKEHIMSHADVLDSPVARTNPEVVAAVTAHNQEHINALRTTDPALLMLLGQTPLPPLPQPGVVASPPPNQVAAPPAPQGMQPGPSPAPPPPHPVGQAPRMPGPPVNPMTHQPLKPQDGAIRRP